MNFAIRITVVVVMIGCGAACAQDPIGGMLDRFQSERDEDVKVRIAQQINVNVIATQKAGAAATENSPREFPRPDERVANLYLRQLQKAESLELVSMLAHSWWMFENHEQDFSKETRELVFRLLDDVRVNNTRSTPKTPRQRAIVILSQASEAVLDDVLNLLDDREPMRRSAGVEILSARGYFEDHFGLLTKYSSDPSFLVRRSVEESLGQIKSRRGEAIDLGLAIMKRGDAGGAVEMALATLASKASQPTAARIQRALLDQLETQPDLHQVHRAIATTMRYVSPEQQHSAVNRIVPFLGSRAAWLEVAVVNAGANATEAIPYMLDRFEEATEGKKLRYALDLWQVERNEKRVIMLFLRGLDSGSSMDRYYSFRGIKMIGRDAEVAVPKLTRMLKSENRVVVRQSLDALVATQTRSMATREAVRDLIRNAHDEHVINQAQETLDKLAMFVE